MKIDRLIGILIVLQQKGSATAPELARRFEVSRRTIQRDIEDICKAGIPLVTRRGAGGGISIMEGFPLGASLFTEGELAAILTGLHTLDSVSASPAAQSLKRKLGGLSSLSEPLNVDLASFYKKDLSDKIAAFRQAIRERRCVSFRYCSPKGESLRLVEPCRIVYRWSQWYLFGYCRARQDFRLFKLRRLWELAVTDEPFSPREVPAEKRLLGSNITDDIPIRAVYDPSVKYRLIEEYGPACFTVQPDGRLYTEWGFSDLSRAEEWFLSFGGRAQVLDPPEMVERMRLAARRLQDLYAE